MTKPWAHKSLQDLLILNRSGFWGDESPSKARPIQVKVIRNADLTKHNSIKGSATRYFSAKEAANAELQIGDIAMSSSGDVGKAWLVNEPGYSASNFIRILRPDANYIMPGFLRYVLESDQGQAALKASTAGTTIQNLQITFYSMLTVPLPPLAEQQRIVRLLDEAFEGIAIAKANAEKNLQKAHELLKSKMQVLFGQNDWKEVQLGQLCTVDWGNTKLTKSAYVEGGEYLAVSASGCDGRIGHREHAKFTPVLSAIGAQCGRMFLPDEDFTAIKNTITLTPKNSNCTGRFLYWLLTYVELPKRGAAQPFISKGDIQNFLLNVPPLTTQESVVELLESLEKHTNELTKVYGNKLAKLDALKHSLLQQAFRGHFKVLS